MRNLKLTTTNIIEAPFYVKYNSCPTSRFPRFSLGFFLVFTDCVSALPWLTEAEAEVEVALAGPAEDGEVTMAVDEADIREEEEEEGAEVGMAAAAATEGIVEAAAEDSEEAVEVAEARPRAL